MHQDHKPVLLTNDNLDMRPSGEQPLVSIITITLNAAETLDRTIQSVINQTYKNLEYIIIDGGSKDRTVDIITKHAHRIDHWISEPDHGISDAFNKGISCAHGEIIGILNASDWYESDTVLTVAHVLKQRPDVDVVCGWLQYWRDSRRDYVFTSNPNLIMKEMTVNHPTMFVRRSVYEKFGMFRVDFRYAMDYEFVLRLIVAGVKVVSLDRILAHMQYEGLTSRNWGKAFAEVKRAKVEHLRKPLAAEGYYWFQCGRFHARLVLERLGLESVINLFRRRFSLLKKTREEPKR
jgi:glycosyltransferase involved in cell wall biosynthesis